MSSSPESEAFRLIRSRSLALFAENGFSGTSLRSIAAAANCDVALIPYYFSNKVNLYKTVVGESMAKARDGIREGFAMSRALRDEHGSDPLETARTQLASWIDSEGPVGIRTLLATLAEGTAAPAEITEFAREELQSCVDLMVSGVPEEHKYALASYASLLFGTMILRDFVRWEKITRMSDETLVEVQVKALSDMLRLSHERAARGEILP